MGFTNYQAFPWWSKNMVQVGETPQVSKTRREACHGWESAQKRMLLTESGAAKQCLLVYKPNISIVIIDHSYAQEEKPT